MSNMTPLVSVIIPIYNESKTLPYLLNDLNSQNFLNVEFILINDGSTDGSQELIENFIRNTDDDRFILINQLNSGVSCARNNGIEKSRGKYIMFADADDRLDKNFVREYVAKIVENNTDMEVFSLKKIDNIDSLNIIERVDYSKLSKRKVTYSDFFRFLADGIIHGYVVTYITKRSLWDSIKFDSKVSYREDEFVYCQMLIKNPDMKIHFNKESYYYYYIHNESATNSLSPSAVLQSIRISEEIIQRANSVRKLNISQRKLNQLKSNFYWRMAVVSIVKKDNKSFSVAKDGYLKFYPRTDFYLKKLERTIEYILLKVHLDFILKAAIQRVKSKD